MTVNYLLQTIAARIALLYRIVFPSLATFLANNTKNCDYLFCSPPTVSPFFPLVFSAFSKYGGLILSLSYNNCSSTTV
jgi:hypothetical protein